MAQNSQIQDFIEKVRWLYEPEYGDFKRKLGLYLERLQGDLGPKGREPRIQNKFSDIRNRVIFQPTGEVESTRNQALSWAEELKDIV